jgi:hypothetical protein
MKRNIIGAIVFLIVFFVLTRVFFNSGEEHGATNYAPDGYKKTIEAEIKGIVTATKQQGLFYAMFPAYPKGLPFSYRRKPLPENWQSVYPADFIQPGDSVYKRRDSDTFFVFRGSKKGYYVLPR